MGIFSEMGFTKKEQFAAFAAEINGPDSLIDAESILEESDGSEIEFSLRPNDNEEDEPAGFDVSDDTDGDVITFSLHPEEGNETNKPDTFDAADVQETNSGHSSIVDETDQPSNSSKVVGKSESTPIPATPAKNNKQEPDDKEAARKAEWEKKHAKKVEKQAAEWQAVQEMDSETASKTSIEAITKGIERMTRRNMKIEVGKFIQQECEHDPEFARLIMHPRKDILRCFKFINQKACDHLIEERKLLEEQGEDTSDMVCGDVPDEICFQWALEYYRTPDLEIDKDKNDEYKPGYTPRATTNSAKKKVASKAKPVLKPNAAAPSILDDMKPLM